MENFDKFDSSKFFPSKLFLLMFLLCMKPIINSSKLNFLTKASCTCVLHSSKFFNVKLFICIKYIQNEICKHVVCIYVHNYDACTYIGIKHTYVCTYIMINKQYMNTAPLIQVKFVPYIHTLHAYIYYMSLVLCVCMTHICTYTTTQYSSHCIPGSISLTPQ